MSQSVYLVAGEISGDTHGAELMVGLRKELGEVVFHGLGGPKMVAEGGSDVEDWVDDAAVMGIVEVIKRYSWFKKRLDDAVSSVKELKPDVLLLIDYQEFNRRLAQVIKAELPETKIVQYVAPQVWAWNQRRIPKVAASLDLMICLFPFEVKFFTDVGLKAVAVGHPLVDELERDRVETERDHWHVGLFPGSREREVAKLFPLMIEVAKELRERFPRVRFSTAAASEKVGNLIHELIETHGVEEGLITVQAGESQKLMQQVGSGVIASGTATLEAAYFGMPFCLVYEVAWGTYVVAKHLLKSKFIGLVNILSGEELAPEFIQDDANVYEIGYWLGTMLSDEEARIEQGNIMRRAASQLGEIGMHERAAAEIGKLLKDNE
ncbi:MAG: lipid-A-disaccharide synthase [Akkermansiaceae bacterium]